MKMTVGQLRERIRIDQRDESENTRKEVVYGWKPLVSQLPAKATPLRGREFFAARQTQAELTVKFTIRYRADVDETMTVVWRGERYDIASPPIDVDGMRVWMELMCKKGVGDGQ